MPVLDFFVSPSDPYPKCPGGPQAARKRTHSWNPWFVPFPRSKMSKAGVNLWMEKLLAGAISSGGDDLRGKQYGGNAGENKGKKDRSDS